MTHHFIINSSDSCPQIQIQNTTLHRHKRQHRRARHGQPGLQKIRLLPAARAGGNDRHDAVRRHLARCGGRTRHEDVHDRTGCDGCVGLLRRRYLGDISRRGGRAIAVPIGRRGPGVVDCRDGLAFVTARCRLDELGRGDPDGGGAGDGGGDGYGDGAVDEHGGPGRPGLVGGGGGGVPLAVIAEGGEGRWLVEGGWGRGWERGFASEFAL